MSVIRIVLREIQHRKLSFVSALVPVIAGVAVLVAVVTMCDASQRATARLTRDLGFNVLIVPNNTDMADFWREDLTRGEMSEEYLHRLANSGLMTVRHLVARLQKKIQWRGRSILLTGVLPEVPVAHRSQRSPMSPSIAPGRAYVGFELARSMSIKVGDSLRFSDKRLVVKRRLLENGNKDDIRIYAHLHDVQQILDKPGRINEIEALGCVCYGGQSLGRIREDIARALPGTLVVDFTSIATAEAETRRMVEKQASLIIPTVLLAAGTWIALLALGNVRERRAEIGILHAMGVGRGTIAAVFIGKALLLGLVGATLGFVVGTWLALHFGPQVFPLTTGKMTPAFVLFAWSLILAPSLCVLATYLPTLLAVTQGPTDVLGDE